MTKQTKTEGMGFTLIELLIVVAIIAILAAIAVPNFLEAQVRAKVSRAKADIRSLATAIEAYAVDSNKYPLPTDSNGVALDFSGNSVASVSGGEIEWFETRLPVSITTPVAFISERLAEPFPADPNQENPQFHYGSRQYVALAEGDTEEYDDLMGEVFFGTTRVPEYFILSHGPDIDHDFTPDGHTHSPSRLQEEHEHEANLDYLYDPTNGSTSSGDVIYYGPGTGFLN